jgi:hypothetical protein
MHAGDQWAWVAAVLRCRSGSARHGRTPGAEQCRVAIELDFTLFALLPFQRAWHDSSRLRKSDRRSARFTGPPANCSSSTPST